MSTWTNGPVSATDAGRCGSVLVSAAAGPTHQSVGCNGQIINTTGAANFSLSGTPGATFSASVVYYPQVDGGGSAFEQYEISGTYGTTPPSTPPTPTGLTATVSGSTITLTWSGGGVDTYQVYRDGVLLKTVPGGTLTTTDTPPGGTAHSYYVTGSITTACGTATSAHSNTASANIAPNAPTLTSPANGVTVDNTVTQRLSWLFSDPNVGDSQSASDTRYSADGGTTWTTVHGSTPNQFTDIAAGTFAAGDYEWQVRTYDSQGLVGPWSASGFFTAATPPEGPTITSPTSGAAIGLSTATVVFSYPTLQSYRWRVLGDDGSGNADTGNVIVDTTTVNDTTSRSFEITGLANNQTIHIQVAVEADELWSDWADQTNTVAYTAPEAPVVTVTGDNRSITVEWTAPAPTGGAPDTASADVWVSGGPEGPIRLATLQPPRRQLHLRDAHLRCGLRVPGRRGRHQRRDHRLRLGLSHLPRSGGAPVCPHSGRSRRAHRRS